MVQSVRLVRGSKTHTLQWRTDEETILDLHNPIVLETYQGPTTSSLNGDKEKLEYNHIASTVSETKATASIVQNGVTGSIIDIWTVASPISFTVTRSVNIEAAPAGAGIRLGLELQPSFPEGVSFNDFQYYAPNACYNLNDLNEDGVCDYLDTQTLSYREDRLNALSVLAYHPQRQLAISLSRADVPKYDSWPDRSKGQLSFLQDTDIGSLGFQPNGRALHDSVLTATYPFHERDRCNALLVQERTPWGAFRPISSGDSFSISYTVRIYPASSAHDALWTLLRQQYQVLKPRAVPLEQSLDDIARSRLDALSKYFMEDSAGGAGFVTNCHPQDGKQLGNVIQYGKYYSKSRSVDLPSVLTKSYGQASLG